MWRCVLLTLSVTAVLAAQECPNHEVPCDFIDPGDGLNSCDNEIPTDLSPCYVTAPEPTTATTNVPQAGGTRQSFKFCELSKGSYLIWFDDKVCKYDAITSSISPESSTSSVTDTSTDDFSSTTERLSTSDSWSSRAATSAATTLPSPPLPPIPQLVPNNATSATDLLLLSEPTTSADLAVRTSSAPPPPPPVAKLEPNNTYIIVLRDSEISNMTGQYVADLAQPGPVQNLEFSITNESIELIWDKPKRISSPTYKIDFGPKNNINRYFNSTVETWNMHGLTPYTEFEVVVSVGEIYLNATKFSTQWKCRVITKEMPPEKVRNVIIKDAVHNLTLNWDLNVTEYNSKEISFFVELRNEWDKPQIKDVGRNQSHTFRNLTPGTFYKFKIYARNCAGNGDTFNGAVQLPIEAPPRNFASITLSHNNMSPTTLTMSVINDKDADSNGNITLYSVKIRASGQKLWTEIKVPDSVSIHKEKWNFTIGDNASCTESDGSCNRPLKPSTAYIVCLRAYTNQTLFTDSSEQTIISAADDTALEAALAALSVVAVCMWGALLWMCGAGDWLRAHVCCGGSAGPSVAPRSPPVTSRPIRLRDFPRCVRYMINETPEKFSEEFEELKFVGREQPCTAANLPCNQTKNRFTNILPYDHSRFKLQPVDDEEGSDYINANYVPGFRSPKGFIATQGPMASTRGDFWRMCWESGASAIVMLTRCVEKGTEKCDHYWPYDETPVACGLITVTLLGETHYCNWTTSELLISKGEARRKVRHFQFTSWPDFGVPSPPSTLLQFVRAFRELAPPDARPVVVHCSAGVGRTGTFICLDRLMLQLASRAEYLDVAGMVHGMRRARTSMVQTEQQYVCVHVCIASVVDAIEVCKRRSTLVSRPPAPTPLPPHPRPARPAPPPPPCSSRHVHYNLAFEGRASQTKPLLATPQDY